MLRPRDPHLLPLTCFCGVAIQEAADSNDSCLPPWQGFQFGHSHLWAQRPEWPHSAWLLSSGVYQIQVCLVMAHQLILVFL